MKRLIFSILLAIMVLPAVSRAQAPKEQGAWATDRPVRAVVVGASIAAYYAGNFGEQLQGACPNLEVINIAHQKDKARDIRHRFEDRFLKNRKLFSRGSGHEYWALVLGGLNEIWAPQRVNLQLLVLFRKAHDAGVKVAGLSLTPWGSDGDRKRWRGIAGLQTHLDTVKVVDFVLGRLTPRQALGRYAGDMEAWADGDLPDVTVDLWASELRDAGAAVRPAGPLKRALHRSRKWRRRVGRLPEEEREAQWKRLLHIARNVPRHYLRRDLRSFDSTHPNREGHRIIAKRVCEKAPASWACDCSLLDKP